MIEPSFEEAQEAFQARRAVETGILCTATAGNNVAETLRDHIRLGADAISLRRHRRAQLPAWRLPRALRGGPCGHRILTDILRDLTARTVLISALYQSNHDAEQSCAEHAAITDAIAANDRRRAAELMTAHIGNVEQYVTERSTT